MFLQKLIADWGHRRKILPDQEIFNHRGSLDAPVLPWNARLKIAKEVAIAITYLHTAFPRIIIHRDIRANNVFLAQNWTAKLTDLSLAVTLPEGGRRPDMDGPEFKYYILDYVKDLQERGEPVEFGGDSNDIRPGQMKMFLNLALRCCAMRNEDRPKMISVAKQIKLIEEEDGQI
uniref:Protein kinase domain-containing protein n=1 Tax=Brassica campestris TaxID=3711 RepID=M4DDP1_BRACM